MTMSADTVEARKRVVYTVGSIGLDLVVGAARFPGPGETLQGGSLEMVPGGKGANQACTVARLEARSVLCGGVGDDVFAGPALEVLRAAGVDTHRVRTYPGATGTAVILVRDDGENSIVISAGANAHLSAEQACDALREAGSGDVLLLQLEVPLAAVIAAAAQARELGCTVFLDPAPAQPLPAELLRQVHLLTPNQTEAAMLLRREPIETTDLRAVLEAANALLATGPEMVALKLGGDGCLLRTRDAAFHVSAFAVQPVDTTAAGDTFSGAFAVAFSEGRALADCVVFASAAAAISVTRRGAQSSIPTRAEVDAFLAAQPAPRVTRL